MLRIAQRCLRLPTPARSIRSFSHFRPTTLHTLRQPRLRPQQVRLPRRQYSIAKAEPLKPTAPAVDEAKLPVSQRLKILFKKYRWPALGIYLGLSVVDFGVAFLAVRAFGTENIGRYEKIILKKVEDTFGWKTKGTPETVETAGSEGASIWTEIALAYTIHKTLFALIRVPVTVAITPSLVKWFQRKGYGAMVANIPAVGKLFQGNASVAARNVK
jgi:hypothetical protein